MKCFHLRDVFGKRRAERPLGRIAWAVLLTATAASLGLVGAPASAALVHFVANPINAANECPPCTAQTGTGAGAFTLDTATGMVTYYIVHTQPNEIASHVHGPAGPCPATAGVVFGLPLGSPKSGTYGPLTAAQQADMQANLHYVNIHSQQCTSGAIRGQIIRATAVSGCCLPSGQCITTTPQTCQAIGGQAQPNPCAGALEACCVNNGCIKLDPVCCLANGGTPQGPGTQCSSFTVACCLPTGGCVQIDPICCDDIGGTSQGPGTSCTQPNICAPPVQYPCCLPDGTCTEVASPTLCQSFGGRPGPQGVPCSQWDCYKNWVLADDFMFDTTQPVPPVNHVRWFGSYLDPAFEPTIGGPPARPVDAWLIAFHRDIAETPCPNPGQFPFDFCGTAQLAPNCPPSNVIFTPDGSSDTYTLLGYVGPFGTRVRVCGTLVQNCTPQCGLACIGVQAVLDCDATASRPGTLIAQFAFDGQQVIPSPQNLIGCDQHRTFSYDVDLPNGCLMHFDPASPEINPVNRVFQPLPGRTYWISIQAVVGVNLIPTPIPGVCQAIANGNQVNAPFWGWHTTPPGYNFKDDAYMGMLGMGCFGEWTYNWMNKLHWSQSPFVNCADDPTKSIDLAFYLGNRTPGGGIGILWCQPIEPGPPAPGAPQRFFPPGDIDEYPFLTGMVDLQLLQFGAANANVAGRMVVSRSDPVIGGINRVDALMLDLDVSGLSGLGNVNLRIRPFQPAPSNTGRYLGTGNDFPCDSFFDIFVDIDLPALGAAGQLTTNAPFQIRDDPATSIWELPSNDGKYVGPPTVIPLFDRNTNQQVGILRRLELEIGYRGGIDIHSDLDWSFQPVDCVCNGDLNGDDFVNGVDIQEFVRCYLQYNCSMPPCLTPLPCPCKCADFNNNGILTQADINLFIDKLLSDPNTACP